MNLSDFLIIYLTVGAPFAVSYFLQNQKKRIGARLLLKTFSAFIFWLPFGFRLLLETEFIKEFSLGKRIFSKNGDPGNVDETEIELFSFQKRFEEVFQKSGSQISIYEFREVFERYVGLTVAANCQRSEASEPEKEFFRIADIGNVETGAICANRRNLKRLKFHQIQARRDFVQIVARLFKVAPDKKKFVKLTNDFCRLLTDVELQTALEQLFPDNLQNKEIVLVNRPENNLWNSETQRPLIAEQVALQLQTLTSTAKTSVKD